MCRCVGAEKVGPVRAFERGLEARRGAGRSLQDVFTEELESLSDLRQELRHLIGDCRYDLWLGPPTEFRLEDGTLVVTFASQASRQWVERNLRTQLVHFCGQSLGTGTQLRLEVAEEGSAGDVLQAGADRGAVAAAQLDALAPQSVSRSAGQRSEGRWSFATFQRGEANQLAVHAARETVRSLGRYSPLVVSGPSGCGKTHLLTALAGALRTNGARLRVLQLTAEQFTSQFLEALDQRQSPSFRHKFRSVDALLLDDVHFLAGKRATLIEFLSTIDALQQRGGQLVLSCVGGPQQLQEISPELASRAAAGLSVAMDLPDYALRLAIVRDMAERCELVLAPAAAELIAQRAVGSARLLSGALNRVAAVSMAEGRVIDRALAERALEAFCREHAPQVRLADIQRAVCDLFGMEASALKSSRKTQSVAQPRMLAMWLARRYTRAALSEIGEFFGRRSHSTVVSAERKVDRLVSGGEEIRVGDRTCRIDDAVRQIEAALRVG
jgi:chromosomal replication initiator protein